MSVAKRISDCNHLLPNLCRLRISEHRDFDCRLRLSGKLRQIDGKHRNVIVCIRALDKRRGSRAVRKTDGERIRALNHMVIGYNEELRVALPDQKAAARAFRLLRCSAAAAEHAVVALHLLHRDSRYGHHKRHRPLGNRADIQRAALRSICRRIRNRLHRRHRRLVCRLRAPCGAARLPQNAVHPVKRQRRAAAEQRRAEHQ